MSHHEELRRLLQRTDLRTADRASLTAMATQLRRGHELTYQERQNLWAYVTRYLGAADSQT